MSGAASPSPAVLMVLAGPAGSGKTTLCDRVVAEVPGFSRVVTATTRPPREGEVNGVSYHFLSGEDFDARVNAGAFLEWAWVHRKHRYGTLSEAILGPLSTGRSLIINVDVQGVENFRRAAALNPLLNSRMTTVFIDVPIEELRVRLAGRGTDGEEEINRRMQTAEHEYRAKHLFDHLITSSDRESDFRALLAILEKARLKAAAGPAY